MLAALLGASFCLFFVTNVSTVQLASLTLVDSKYNTMNFSTITMILRSLPISTNSVGHTHRVNIERKSPYKESYTVNSHWKMFGDVSQPKVA